jgi:uncharacterized membrane protein YeiH
MSRVRRRYIFPMLYVLQLLGVAVFAASGAIAAGRKRMDLLGVAVLAIVTAVGGGTIRDVVLDRQVFWIKHPEYIAVCLAAALAIVVYTRFKRPPANTLAIADALGLGLFTIVGAQVTREQQVNVLIVVIMGAMTGVAGGVIRDILSAEIPVVLQRGELYASAAIMGTLIYLGLGVVHVAEPVAAIVGMVAVVVIRFLSVFWSIELPVPRIGGDD